MRTATVVAIAVALVSASAFAALIDTKYDGPLPQVYNNGGGSGFGGTLGGGSISFDESGGNLVISFSPGNALNDVVAIYLDTRPGGYGDAAMDDQADGGRRVISNLTRDVLDSFPTGMNNGLPDFALAIGGWGAALFELTAGSTPGHLNFMIYNAGTSITVPLSALGSPLIIDWFAAYCSETNWCSNESMPYSAALNAGPNPGWTGPTPGYENFNRFVIPEPATLALFVLGAAGLIRRRD